MDAAAQFELITDDPRRDVDLPSPIQEFRRFRALQKEHGNLLTTSQAARILGVTPQQVNVWIYRKRFTSFLCLGAKMIPASEVVALYKERLEEGPRTGGRGNKAPSLSEMVKLMWSDLDTSDY